MLGKTGLSRCIPTSTVIQTVKAVRQLRERESERWRPWAFLSCAVPALARWHVLAAAVAAAVASAAARFVRLHVSWLALAGGKDDSSSSVHSTIPPLERCLHLEARLDTVSFLATSGAGDFLALGCTPGNQATTADGGGQSHPEAACWHMARRPILVSFPLAPLFLFRQASWTETIKGNVAPLQACLEDDSPLPLLPSSAYPPFFVQLPSTCFLTSLETRKPV